MIGGPGAAMLDSKLFVSRLNGEFRDLYERWWDGDSGSGSTMANLPAVPSPVRPARRCWTKNCLSFVVADGSLWERHWRARTSDAGPGTAMERPAIVPSCTVSAEMLNEKFFVVTDDGHL
ncbi:MAG: hypothetical protein MRJ92_11080 [Nitrospira sp.]|nr:hypothetical protein [Nitrospira sp.]